MKIKEFLEFYPPTLAHSECLVLHHTVKLGRKVRHNLIFALGIFEL